MNFSKFFRVLEFAIPVLYSLAIIASSLPRFANISNTVVVVYYLFVPGYTVTVLFKEKYNLIFRLGYSILYGLAFVLCIFAFRQIFPGVPLSFAVIIPSITIAVSLFHFVSTRHTVVLNR